MSIDDALALPSQLDDCRSTILVWFVLSSITDVIVNVLRVETCRSVRRLFISAWILREEQIVVVGSDFILRLVMHRTMENDSQVMFMSETLSTGSIGIYVVLESLQCLHKRNERTRKRYDRINTDKMFSSLFFSRSFESRCHLLPLHRRLRLFLFQLTKELQSMDRTSSGQTATRWYQDISRSAIRFTPICTP